jgi:proteasome accessory factor B
MGGDSTVMVELRFNSRAAGPVQERLWHPSQQTQLLSDGTLHFQVDVADLREMQPWIRSWGADVEVLAPESLRAEMVDQARELAQIYLI